MQFKSDQTKKEFLDQLESITKGGSPNLETAKNPIFKLFTKRNQLPFYGIIRENGFHLSIVKGLSNPSIALDAEIKDTENGISIKAKFDFLIFPALFKMLIVGSLIFISFQVEDLILLILPIPILITIGFYFGIRGEKKKIIKRFIDNTSATEI